MAAIRPLLALGDRTWTELGERAWLIVPLGSTEQHGPHLPLDTDTRIAVAIAERLAANLSDSPGRSAAREVLVAPAMAIGASGEHAGFAGTLSVGTSVLEEVVVEIGRSADRFAGVVWCNAHGGNAAALERAHRRLVEEGRRSRCVHVAFDGDLHAGRTETSVMLAIAPETVRVDRMQPGVTGPWSEIGERIRRRGVAAVSRNGVLGDPTGASAAEGERLIGDLVARLATDLAAGPETI
ncbi:MAG: mycofactocin biosynthesis peptidyl-dipeptidase MftE [Microthrixaceae bacterium]